MQGVIKSGASPHEAVSLPSGQCVTDIAAEGENNVPECGTNEYWQRAKQTWSSLLRNTKKVDVLLRLQLTQCTSNFMILSIVALLDDCYPTSQLPTAVFTPR